MPSPKTTNTRCTGCRCWYMTTKQQALKELHFHDAACAHRWHTGTARSDRGRKAVWKTCEFCHSRFRAGGRAENGRRLPNKTQRWCDKTCAGRAKENKGKECLLLSPDFARWASGFFEGEGSVFMVVEGTRKRPFAEVSIGSTDRNVICHFIRETGLGKPNHRKATDPEQKDLYMWRCYAGAAISFLRQVDSFLIAKRAIVDFVFNCYQAMRSNLPRAYDPLWRAQVLETSNSLNARGPAGARRRNRARPSAVEKMFKELTRSEPYTCKNPTPKSLEVNLKDQRWTAHPQTNPGKNLCPIDGKEISHPKNLTCSRECALIFRKRRGTPCCVINPILKPYLAGLIDGEGCIEIKRSYSTVHARISFGNTNKRIVYLIKNITGIGSISPRPPKTAKHSKSWHWHAQSDGAHGLIEQISPFLKVKQRQAESAIHVQYRLDEVGSRRDRAWQVDAIAESHRLNKKGPQPEC